jgi:N-acylneuraminate cytidylyltransferase
MIPARANSRRIPNKNIKDFLGKPIITYPIETAKASGIFDDIVVYTDNPDIGSIAIENNILSWKRNPASDNETLTETVLNFLSEEKFKDIDYLCVLLPTAVFVDKKVISYLTLETLMKRNEYDCAITFCKYHHPIQRAFMPLVTGMKMVNTQFEFARTQDLLPHYYDAGQMYFLNVKSFLKQKRIFMDNIYPIIIDAVDIDNPEDWKKAEAFYKVIYD